MDRKQGRDRRVTWVVLTIGVAALGLCIGAGGLGLVGRAYSQHYAGRIYPGVSVYGVNLGGLTADEAAATLQSALPHPAALPLTLRDGDRSWNHSWADLGLSFDLLATARLAYQAGRTGTAQQQSVAQLRALVAGLPLSPVVVLPDPAQATSALEVLAPEVAVPPVNAALIIQSNRVIPVPAQAGRELDVAETVTALARAIVAGREGLVLQLLTRQVEPAIGNPGPAQAQIETLLSRPFTLVADDPLTGFRSSWAVKAEEVAQWIIAQPARLTQDGGEPRLVLAVQEQPLRAYLDGLARQVTGAVALDAEATLAAVRAAIEAGQDQARVALIHPPRPYVVQPGDTLVSVAHAHGFPVWWLTESNPGLEPGALQPGQQIVIPSIDGLFPFPLITDRRIVIDISDQHLYVYEGDTLVHDFLCSTGIASSPTITGTFQVLSKEEMAYASSWDLWMPHFIGIYRSGPDFTNGIHALPTLSSGASLWEGYLGSPISYGCIVIGLNEGAALYEWADLGTLVVIQE